MKNNRASQDMGRGVGAARRETGSGAPEKIKIKKDGQAVNGYYLRVSKRYKAAKFLTLAVLLCYLIVMMCMHRSSITYDNLMYLVRDFETDVDVSSKGFEGISYGQSDRMSFAFYKDRLAVATGGGFTLYNTTGAVELEYGHSMENPKIEAGDKYALVYDIGGVSYSIYNTIARVSTKNAEFVLQGAHMSDSGEYALITRSKENRYLVSFYDSSFRELTRVYKDKYVTDVALSHDGKKYAIVSCDVTSSDFTVEIMSGTVRSDSCSTFTLDGLLPLSVGWFDDGSFAVVCDSAVIFADGEGNMTSRYDYGSMILVTSDISGDRLLVTGGENTVGSLSKGVLLDSAGSMVDSFSHGGKISLAALSDRFIFYSSGEELMRRDMQGNTEVSACPAYTVALVPCFDNVAVCTDTGIKMGFENGSDGENPRESETHESENHGETDGVGEAEESAEETLSVELEDMGG